MGLASREVFFDGLHYLSFLPGQCQTFDMGEEFVHWPIYDKFCIHFSAKEPVVAEFEIALDNALQDYTLTANVEAAFHHALAIVKCKTPRIITIRRKETDSQTPVFVFAVDGVPSNVEVTGAARLYRAASCGPQGYR